MTAAEIRPLLFPRIKGPFDLLMSLGETLAHIHYLVEEGELAREFEAGAWRFRCVGTGLESTELPGDIHSERREFCRKYLTVFDHHSGDTR